MEQTPQMLKESCYWPWTRSFISEIVKSLPLDALITSFESPPISPSCWRHKSAGDYCWQGKEEYRIHNFTITKTKVKIKGIDGIFHKLPAGVQCMIQVQSMCICIVTVTTKSCWLDTNASPHPKIDCISHRVVTVVDESVAIIIAGL